MKDIIYFCNPVSINKLSSISSLSESISYCWKDLSDDYCNYFKSTHYAMSLFLNMNREDTEVSLFSNNDDSFPMLARIERSFIRESVLNKGTKQDIVDKYRSIVAFNKNGFIKSISRVQVGCPENHNRLRKVSVYFEIEYDMEKLSEIKYCPDSRRKYDIDYVSNYLSRCINNMFNFTNNEDAFLAEFEKIFMDIECNFNYKLLKGIKKISKYVADIDNCKERNSHIEIIEVEDGYKLIANIDNNRIIKEYHFTPRSDYAIYNVDVEKYDDEKMIRIRIGD